MGVRKVRVRLNYSSENSKLKDFDLRSNLFEICVSTALAGGIYLFKHLNATLSPGSAREELDLAIARS